MSSPSSTLRSGISRAETIQQVLEMHWRLCGDQVRRSMYERAFRKIVKPTSVVLDLGCGTGILGLLAWRAGAARVYALDSTGILEAARAVSRAANAATRIVHVSGDCADASLPEPVDLIVADQMGALGFEANLVSMFNVAARRFLRPGGLVVPGRVHTWIAPAQSASVRDAIERWAQPVDGEDFSPLRHYAAHSQYTVHPEDVQLLADGKAVACFSPGTDTPSQVWSKTCSFDVRSSGWLNGLCGWFVASLADGVEINNRADDECRVDRRVGFLPIDPAVGVELGDRIETTIRLRPVDNLIEWRGLVYRDSREIRRFSHSTLPGLSLASARAHRE